MPPQCPLSGASKSGIQHLRSEYLPDLRPRRMEERAEPLAAQLHTLWRTESPGWSQQWQQEQVKSLQFKEHSTKNKFSINCNSCKQVQLHNVLQHQCVQCSYLKGSLNFFFIFETLKLENESPISLYLPSTVTINTVLIAINGALLCTMPSCSAGALPS